MHLFDERLKKLQHNFMGAPTAEKKRKRPPSVTTIVSAITLVRPLKAYTHMPDHAPVLKQARLALTMKTCALGIRKHATKHDCRVLPGGLAKRTKREPHRKRHACPHLSCSLVGAGKRNLAYVDLTTRAKRALIVPQGPQCYPQVASPKSGARKTAPT